MPESSREHVPTASPKPVPAELLAAAIKADDAQQLARTLERYPELKSTLNKGLPQFGFGATPLIAAVQRQSKAMIELLLQAGADINARTDWWAGGFGVLDDDRGLATFLIERGAIVDVHAAARLSMLTKLKELISADPERVHARGGDGQTPLHFAATTEIADYLLAHGAEIDALDIDHESTPAQYMVRDRQSIARHLIARGCRTDILLAAALGEFELVRKHLDDDPECIRVNVSEKYFPKRNPRAGGTIYIWTLGQYKTPHVVAREFGHEEVFRLLMDRSPAELKLAQAAELGDERLFQELLSKNPDWIRGMSDSDRRKLVNAAQNNNTEAVRLMLSAGWPVDVRGQHGGTALHWAAYHGNAEMTKLILRHNPPLECLDRENNATPLGWAIHGSEHGWHARTGNYAGTVQALLEAGAKRPDKIEGADAVQNVLRGSSEASRRSSS